MDIDMDKDIDIDIDIDIDRDIDRVLIIVSAQMPQYTAARIPRIREIAKLEQV